MLYNLLKKYDPPIYLNIFFGSSYALRNHSSDSFGFAFVDAGCVLKMYYRMENTPGAIFTVASKKAQTAW